MAEGDAGSSNATLTVSLSAASEKTVEVDYATSDGTAAAGNDYSAAAGTLTFAPGDTDEHIAVPVLGDMTDEGKETVAVGLSGESNATVSDGSAVSRSPTTTTPRPTRRSP